MIKEIRPLSGSINARIIVPGSKSITNRALICTALAKGESVIHNASDSNDTALMINGLNQLGVLVRRSNNELMVEGTGGKLYAPKFPIPVGNAGTTLRFMLSLAALAQGKTVFEGSERMAERPIDDLMNSLSALGVKTQVQNSRYTIEGPSLRGGTTKLNAAKSSQFLSSLLMVAPYAEKDITIELEGTPSSFSYVEMTLAIMKQFGISITANSSNIFMIESGRRYIPSNFDVEPDASGASYFFAAAAICGGEIFVEGVRRNSLQGDSGFLKILAGMGCEVFGEENGVRVNRTGVLKGIDVDMNSMPDVVPTLAVVALFACTPTRIRNIGHLRHKESDRLQALETELRELGGAVTIFDDMLEIQPSQLHDAQLETYNDHRLAMAFALTGLKVPGVRIENPDCVKKSFPKFWSEFEKVYSNQS